MEKGRSAVLYYIGVREDASGGRASVHSMRRSNSVYLQEIVEQLHARRIDYRRVVIRNLVYL